MGEVLRYSEYRGLETFLCQGRTYIDQGYCLDQSVRVKRGNEVVVGTVVALTLDILRSRSYVEGYPPTITVEATWKNGDTTKVEFNPETKFPPDFGGQQFHFQEMLD